MRKIRLRLSLANKNLDNPGGKLFKLYIEKHEKGSFFEVKDKILTFEMQFEEMPTDVIEVISSIPFDEIEELIIEDMPEEPTVEVEREESKDRKDKEIVKEEYLERKETQLEKLDVQVEQSIDSSKEALQTEEKKRHPRRVKKIPDMDEKGQKVFDNIVNNSKDFDDFIQRIGDYINVGDTYRSLFNDMVYATVLSDCCAWSEIINNMKNPEGKKESKRIVCTKKVADAFRKEGSTVTILVLLKNIKKYKDYDFGVEAKESKTAKEANEASKEMLIENDSETESFSVFSKELLDEVKSCTSFEEKVAVIVDMIKPVSISEEVFQENRIDVINTLVELAKEFSVESALYFLEAMREANVPEEKAHVVKAFVLQIIRDYCTGRNVMNDGAEQKFFEDLIKLM